MHIGERSRCNNVSLTVKFVVVDHEGKVVKCMKPNFMSGSGFFMSKHPKSQIAMICTGAGSAPVRAMTEWRRGLRQCGKLKDGKLLLFFGTCTHQELPYFGPLKKLANDFIRIHLVFSRTPNQPKRYEQDAMR